MKTKSPIIYIALIAVVIVVIIAALVLMQPSSERRGPGPSNQTIMPPIVPRGNITPSNQTITPPIVPKENVTYSQPAVCGNGICEVSESDDCDADCHGCKGSEPYCWGPGCYFCRCNNTCGNGYCEECEDCQQDCGYCGDGICQTFNEFRENCKDCAACGDGYCSCSFENPDTCPKDCQGASQNCLDEYANAQEIITMAYSAQCPAQIPVGSAALSVSFKTSYPGSADNVSEVTVNRLLSASKSERVGVIEGGAKLCILLTAGEQYFLEAWRGDFERGEYGSFQDPLEPQSGELIEVTIEMNQVVY